MARLHHVFVFVAPDPAPLPDLVESFRREHPGQGTANVCYDFGNGYLELLWVTDRAALAAPDLAPTGLAARSCPLQAGSDVSPCPFGIAIETDKAPPPFPTWNYAPPFLPPGLSIPVATDSANPAWPFVFVAPTVGRPPPMRQPGLGGIVGLHLDCPTLPPADAAVMALAEAGLLTLRSGAPWRLVLDIEREHANPPRHLELPAARWV